VIFNFPHSGVPNYQKTSAPSNQALLQGVFLATAPLLRTSGELRVTLRKDPVYHAWRIMEQAETAFRLVRKQAKRALCPVDHADFPFHKFFGYRHAATVEDRAVDNPESTTWVFRLLREWAPPPELHAKVESQIEWSQGTYRCALCDITFRSNKQLDMHEQGRRHKDAVANKMAGEGRQ